ncbi:MAG: hypothetical protein ABII23_03130 [bacterium]
MRKIKRLQVFINGQWDYVFCHNPSTGIIITKHREKAIKDHGLEYFKGKYGNHEFRLVDKTGYIT